VSASPPASGSKSAAGSRVPAKPQKELPPVAFLRQRPHRLPSLRAFRLNASRSRNGKQKHKKNIRLLSGKKEKKYFD